MKFNINKEQLSFPIKQTGIQFRFEKDGKSAAWAEFENGEISFALFFDSHDSPLTVRAKAKLGDIVRVVCLPYRMELYVNDKIADEEWGFGKTELSEAELSESTTELSVLPIAEKAEEPIVTGHFTGAEGWRPGGGVFVGDCMPYSIGDRYHVLYLKDRHHHRSKWGKGAHQWAHISTGDLVNWDVHPMAVEIDDQSEGSICTGSWICENGRHSLYYTVRQSDGSSAPICRSVSEDGYHYTKDKGFRITLSDRYNGASARDPKVVRDENGILHLFVTTTDLQAQKGCLVHLTSADGEKWEENGTIYTSPSGDEPECTDYFKYGGRYYLIFSLCGCAQYRYSDKPFADWIEPDDPYIPCGNVPKAAVWRDRIIFAGFVGMGGYGGYMTFKEAKPKENGELEFSVVPDMK